MEQKTMQALCYYGPGKYSLDDVPVPQIIEATDVIAKVTMSTICTSDIHIVHGHLASVNEQVKTKPKIVGHEFIAEVVEMGAAVKGFKPGQRVIVKVGIECLECAMCKIGIPTFCAKGGCFGASGPDGCQAEFIRIPLAEHHMIPIPEGLNDEDVLLLSDMLCTAWFGVKNANITPGQSVAVFGVGPVGQCVCILAKKVFGAKTVIAIDTIQSRLDAALKAGVADLGLNVGTDDVAKKIAEATAGMGVDASIETAGFEATLNAALDATRCNGTVSVISIFAQPVTLPMQKLIYKNLTIKMGIQKCDGIDEMLQLIKEGKIDTKYLLTHRAPLNDIMKGYEVFGNHEDDCIKWVVTPLVK